MGEVVLAPAQALICYTSQDYLRHLLQQTKVVDSVELGSLFLTCELQINL